MHKTRLSLNLNAVAWLRNRRDLPWPDLLQLADIGMAAGASGLTVHPRPDQRHIRFSDVKLLSDFLRNKYPQASFNIEGYPSREFLDLAIPYADQITLVPDAPEQKTSYQGWDVSSVENRDFLQKTIEYIKERGDIKISVFVNPGMYLTRLAGRSIDNIEIYTGGYAVAYNNNYTENILKKILATAMQASEFCFKINAGHDLTVDNLPKLISYIPDIYEVSIGHALISDALIYGMEASVKRFLSALNNKVE